MIQIWSNIDWNEKKCFGLMLWCWSSDKYTVKHVEVGGEISVVTNISTLNVEEVLSTQHEPCDL